MRAIVLAGGKGRRLAPFTHVLPKPLMPISDIPILEVVLIQLKKAGFNHITIAVGHLASLIQTFFDDGSRWGIKIDYFYEEHPLGTAGCIAHISDLGEDFLVINGDVLCNIDYSDFLAYHKRHNGLATIATFTRQLRTNFGVIQVNSENMILDYIEKPTHELMVSMGIYLLNSKIKAFLNKGECIDFPDLMKRLLKDNKKVMAYSETEYWLDIGREDDYRRAVSDFEKLKDKFIG